MDSRKYPLVGSYHTIVGNRRVTVNRQKTGIFISPIAIKRMESKLLAAAWQVTGQAICPGEGNTSKAGKELTDIYTDKRI